MRICSILSMTLLTGILFAQELKEGGVAQGKENFFLKEESATPQKALLNWEPTEKPAPWTKTDAQPNLAAQKEGGKPPVPEINFDKLASPDFQEREEMQKKLMDWAEPLGKVALLSIFKKYEVSDDPELRNRLFGSLLTLHGMMPKGFIGVRMEEVMIDGFEGFNQTGGVQVTAVEPGTPAAKAGLRSGDIIWEVNGLSLQMGMATSFFSNEIKSYFAGDTVELKILSGRKSRKIEIVLGELPPLEERLRILPPQILLFDKNLLIREEALQEREQFERWMKRESEKLKTKKTP